MAVFVNSTQKKYLEQHLVLTPNNQDGLLYIVTYNYTLMLKRVEVLDY